MAQTIDLTLQLLGVLKPLLLSYVHSRVRLGEIGVSFHDLVYTRSHTTTRDAPFSQVM